jgi:histidyl-tRNA synthetase
MFRYARAQRGRYREHWQFGVESLGSDDPAVDAEIIALQAAWFGELGLLDGLELQLNSIGDPACRPAYRSLLVAYLERYRSELSEDSRARLEINPMRIFDSKDEGDQRIVSGAPRITDHLCDACSEHFASVRAFLDARGVDYSVTPELVRGLDYYERTAWEWVLPEGGSQAGSLSGGGRYDGLSQQIGGERVPGVGFGCGAERVVLALEAAGVEPLVPRVDWFCACEDAAARPAVHALLERARARGLSCQGDLAGRSLKGQLRHGERLGARIVTVCRAGDGARGIVRHGGAEIAFGDVVDYVERSVRDA